MEQRVETHLVLQPRDKLVDRFSLPWYADFHHVDPDSPRRFGPRKEDPVGVMRDVVVERSGEVRVDLDGQDFQLLLLCLRVEIKKERYERQRVAQEACG